MHPTPTRERELRDELVRSATRLRTELARCPALDYLTEPSRSTAVTHIENATAAFAELTSITTELRALTELSEEAIFVLASSEMALAVVGEALALITGELDSSAAA